MEIKLSLHRKQREIYDHAARFKVLCAGRRFGKSRLAIWKAVFKSLDFPGTIDPLSPETVLLTEPTLVMAKQILWRPLIDLCEKTDLKKLVKDINRSEHRIDFISNKPPIVVAGTNDGNGDGLRGKRLWYYGGDEFQDTTPGVFDTVIRPALSDTKGSTAMLSFTPKGTLNHTYELFQRCHKDSRYASFLRSSLDNPFVDKAEIETARLTLPPRIFRQEFEASFETFASQVYQELSEANKCSVASVPERFDLVVSGVDFGDRHPAITVLGQRLGVWYFLEAWSPKGERPIPQPVFDSEAVRLVAKYNVQYVYCDPSRPSAILALRALGEQYRLQGLTRAIAGFNRISEGNLQVASLIYTGRLQFPIRSRADEPGTSNEVYYGADAYPLFEAYSYKTDKGGNATEEIAPGQFDHCVDSTRYALAVPDGLPSDTKGG